MSDQDPVELRLALGMRGGVSLAVWIGGACAELDELRRASRDGSAGFWPDRLAESEYDAVAIDVMAGASAGGLNAVLLAVSQHYDIEFGSFRDVWLEDGGLADLVRRRSPDGRSPSLLDGDDGFLRVIYLRLLGLIDERRPTAEAAGPRVDVQLTATHVVPITRRTARPEEEEQLVARSSAGFRYRNQPVASWDEPEDLPPWAPPAAEGAEASTERQRFETALWRLVLGARSTSSFPVAFEPALVWSPRPMTFAAAGDPPAAVDLRAELAHPSKPVPLVDASSVFSDASRNDARSTFAVIDGGWLDNIPLGRALQAIAEAPASGRTERYLLYLHPGEPTPPNPKALAEGQAPDPANDPRREVPSVARGMVKAVWASETIAADIEELEAHNRSVGRGGVVRAQALADLTDPDRSVSGAFASYRVLRASTDAAKLRRLLDDPLGVLGSDPFPSVVRRPRDPLALWEIDEREQLDQALGQAFALDAAAPLADGILTNGLGPLQRSCQLLLDWIRALDAPTAADRTALDDAKATGYRTLLFVEHELNRARRLAWVTLASNRPPPDAAGLLGWAAGAMDDVDRLMGHDDTTVAAVIATLNGAEATDEGIATLRRTTALRLDGLAGGVALPRAGEDVRRAIFRSVLAPIVERFATAGASDDPGRPGTLLHRVLGPGWRGRPDPLERLAALEVLCLPEFLDGTPGQRPIRYRRLSASAPTPLKGALTALSVAGGQRWVAADGREEERAAMVARFGEGWGKVPIDLKLAGNELGNFSAFLRADWRRNDWVWGRLDAASVLVDLLCPAAPDREKRAWIEARQREILCREWACTPTELDARLAAYKTGAEGIADARGEDLHEIASRLARSAGEVIRSSVDELDGSEDKWASHAERAASVVETAGTAASWLWLRKPAGDRPGWRSLLTTDVLGPLLVIVGVAAVAWAGLDALVVTAAALGGAAASILGGYLGYRAVRARTRTERERLEAVAQARALDRAPTPISLEAAAQAAAAEPVAAAAAQPAAEAQPVE